MHKHSDNYVKKATEKGRLPSPLQANPSSVNNFLLLRLLNRKQLSA
jgi:hypothetical protein